MYHDACGVVTECLELCFGVWSCCLSFRFTDETESTRINITMRCTFTFTISQRRRMHTTQSRLSTRECTVYQSSINRQHSRLLSSPSLHCRRCQAISAAISRHLQLIAITQQCVVLYLAMIGSYQHKREGRYAQRMPRDEPDNVQPHDLSHGRDDRPAREPLIS